MPQNTPNGYPYPLGTDPISQGDDTITALAQAIDTRLRTSAAGKASVTTTAGQPTGSAVVTFPVGRFAVPPTVTASCIDASTYFANVGSVTAAGCTVNIRHWSGSTNAATITVNWAAVGVG